MPWTPAQVRLFAAAAHDKGIAKKTGIPQAKARQMEMESTHKERSQAMKGRAQGRKRVTTILGRH